MSAPETNPAPSGTNTRLPYLISIALIFALAIGVSLYLTQDRERPLDQSAMGHSGLITWLRAGGIEARSATGFAVTPDKVGLRILPLHDTDLTRDFVQPTEKSMFLRSGTEYDISLGIVRRKLELLPSLIIAPKWSRTVRYSGFAHESLLLSVNDASRPFRQFGITGKPLLRPGVRQLEISANIGDGRILSATLFAPQLFANSLPPDCRSIVSNALGHLIIRCDGNARPFYALADPDLMNNHGLMLGQNAELIKHLIVEWSDGKPVLADATSKIFTTPSLPLLPKREWSDLLRLFSYPFSILWGGICLITFLALWRTWLRFGPPVRVFDDNLGASKSVSIAAKARLLRLSGDNQKLFAVHIMTRLRLIEETLFGRDTIAKDPVKRIFLLIRRRDPELADGFGVAATAALTPDIGMSPAELLKLVDKFEEETEKVLHEFGRTS